MTDRQQALDIRRARRAAMSGGLEYLVAPPGAARMPTQPYAPAADATSECPQCHSLNSPAAAWCTQCGTQVRPSAIPPAADAGDTTQACTAGHWNRADAKFCTACGQGLTGGASGRSDWQDLAAMRREFDRLTHGR